MRSDARTIELLRRLELDAPGPHALLIEHLESFPYLELGRRMWCLANAEWRPVWEYCVALPLRDALPAWFVAEFRDGVL